MNDTIIIILHVHVCFNCILQDATVRKLYRIVRHDLKVNWGINDSIQLVNGSIPLVKNDSKMNAVSLYNGITLYVVFQSGPYTWDLFVKLPGRSSAITVTLYEVLLLIAKQKQPGCKKSARPIRSHKYKRPKTLISSKAKKLNILLRIFLLE